MRNESNPLPGARAFQWRSSAHPIRSKDEGVAAGSLVGFAGVTLVIFDCLGWASALRPVGNGSGDLGRAALAAQGSGQRGVADGASAMRAFHKVSMFTTHRDLLERRVHHVRHVAVFKRGQRMIVTRALPD